jgi:hypothetical protein
MPMFWDGKTRTTTVRHRGGLDDGRFAGNCSSGGLFLNAEPMKEAVCPGIRANWPSGIRWGMSPASQFSGI